MSSDIFDWITEPSSDAIKLSENDKQRSDFVCKLVQSTDTLTSITPDKKDSIPKVIVQFWDDKNDIPSDVHECINTWKQLEYEGFEHVLFDDESAIDFIAKNLSIDHVKAFQACYHPAMKSDYFRLCFIFCSGGMYVDVDDINCKINIEHLFTNSQLKLQPLCYDIETDEMVEPERFTKQGSFSDSWIFYFNNNPIIAAPQNPIVGYALRRATHILNQDDCDLPEIQSTTGPGNMTASTAAHFINGNSITSPQCIDILSQWQTYARTIWHLSYRNDRRNWRLSNRKRYS